MRKRILVQSDDYGMTYGITDGTIRAIKDGIVKNTGLFVNMDSSEYAAERVKEVDVCLGIDINLLAGKPVSDVNLIPSLVNEDGYFRSSRQLLSDYDVVSTDKYLYHFEEDPFDYEETLIETENQVKKFIELVGRLPEYMNSHSVITPNSEKAAKEVAEKYGIKRRSSELYFDDNYIDLAYQGEYEPSSSTEQIDQDYTEMILEHILPNIPEGPICFNIFHCGYVDKDIFGLSSLTMQRMNDVASATDTRIINYVKDNNIELITYRDL